MESCELHLPLVLICDVEKERTQQLEDILAEQYLLFFAYTPLEAKRMLNDAKYDIDCIIVSQDIASQSNNALLEYMNQARISKRVPVLLYRTSEQLREEMYFTQQIFADFFLYPFDPYIVRYRVTGNMLVFNQRKELMHTLAAKQYEQERDQFFASMSNELQFEYLYSTDTLMFSGGHAKDLDFPKVIHHPESNKQLVQALQEGRLEILLKLYQIMSPEKCDIVIDGMLPINGVYRWHHIRCHAIFSTDEPNQIVALVGKASDFNDEQLQLLRYKKMATTDSLTGLYNPKYTKKRITSLLTITTNEYALIVLDLDNFKGCNDHYGHAFGDEVLVEVSKRMHTCTRSMDIAGRIGGDEFVIFVEDHGNAKETVERILNTLCGPYNDYSIQVSMGIARTSNFGRNYDTLFNYADSALYAAKKRGKGIYHFATDDQKKGRIQYSPIDSTNDTSALPTNDIHQLLSQQDFNAIIPKIQESYSGIHLIDATLTKQYSWDASGEIVEESRRCFSNWNRMMRCDNCISAKCLSTKKPQQRFEMLDGQVYLCNATYLEIDNIPFILETTMPIAKENSDLFPESVFEDMLRQEEEHYVDKKTKLHNRAFFDEQLRYLPNASAMVMVHVDDPSQIREISRLLVTQIRHVDDIIRYNDQDFLIIFWEMSEKFLSRKVTIMQQALELGHYCTYMKAVVGPQDVSTLINILDDERPETANCWYEQLDRHTTIYYMN